MNSIIEEVREVDWHLVLPIMIPFMLVNTVLLLIAFIDMYIYREHRANKVIWILIILFINILGPVLYLAIGRKRG
ncbi:phosphatidylserine synthase [Bacillus sp. J14TS2]|uniref:PLDc N-terminal domain-containing protein n=1 Tax=Bacillus sp. J14TS2 TaxID=2807188 RepID=UPI001B2B357C|nr:PLDc N-terminal domain-containing protein [Bacillus sp. J14TS2]GIN73403.1 phosphatidylserine synthase [Bacillus sp. J14TS2]